jgi:hypothetical protein
MTSDHGDTATTWRDLADQLTPQQIAELKTWEQKWPDEHNGFLVEARSYAEQNLDDKLMFGHLDAPEGATRVWPAGKRMDGTWVREFSGTARLIAGVTVYIDGDQSVDGSVKRVLSVGVSDLREGPGGELSGEQARQLAAVLVEAADELDRLSAGGVR